MQKQIARYNVRIAEDDGEIDTDLPGTVMVDFIMSKLFV